MKVRNSSAQIEAAHRKLSAVIASGSLSSRAKVIACKRAMDDRAVLTGILDGSDVYFKLYSSTEKCEKVWGLQCRKYAELPSKFSIAAPLVCDAKNGLLITKKVNGQPYNIALRGAGLEATVQLYQKAGKWLHTFVDYQENGRCFPFKMLERTEQVLPRFPKEDRKVVQTAVDHLKTYASEIRQADVKVGSVHGDFAPMNLMLDLDGNPVGIDIESTYQMPVLTDVAKFLVVANHFHPPARQQFYGLSQTAFDAFSKGWGGFSKFERETLLPFFLGRALIDHFSALGQSLVQRHERRTALLRYLKAAKDG